MLAKIMGTCFIVVLMLVSANIFAADNTNQPQQGQQQNQGTGNRPSRVPPESAISACSGKSEGTACQVTGPNGTKQGVCVHTPDQKYYACKPHDMNTIRATTSTMK